MVHHLVLTLCIVVVVSFNSVGKILGGIVTDCKIVFSVDWEPGIDKFGVCVMDCTVYLLWRWDGRDGRGNNGHAHQCREADGTNHC